MACAKQATNRRQGCCRESAVPGSDLRTDNMMVMVCRMCAVASWLAALSCACLPPFDGKHALEVPLRRAFSKCVQGLDMRAALPLFNTFEHL